MELIEVYIQFYDVIVYIFIFEVGDIFNSKNKLIGKVLGFQNDYLITLEVDLRFNGVLRTLKFFVNYEQQKYYISNLPFNVTFAV